MTTKPMTAGDIRNALFAKRQRRIKQYEVRGLGLVSVQSLTERERAELELAASKDPVTMRCRMIAAAVVDDEGNKVFSADDVESIGNVDARLVIALAEAVSEHCGIIDEDHEADEEAIKN